jgi:hypothetical protein
LHFFSRPWARAVGDIELRGRVVDARTGEGIAEARVRLDRASMLPLLPLFGATVGF